MQDSTCTLNGFRLRKAGDQGVLVGEKVMKTAILIVLLLIIFSIMGFLMVLSVHLTLKDEFKEKEWMDNSEFDYGYNVRHDYTEF